MERKQHVWYRERKMKKQNSHFERWQWTLVTRDIVITKTFPHASLSDQFLAPKIVLSLAHRRIEVELHRQKRLLVCPRTVRTCGRETRCIKKYDQRSTNASSRSVKSDSGSVQRRVTLWSGWMVCLQFVPNFTRMAKCHKERIGEKLNVSCPFVPSLQVPNLQILHDVHC